MKPWTCPACKAKHEAEGNRRGWTRWFRCECGIFSEHIETPLRWQSTGTYTNSVKAVREIESDNP